MHEFPHIVVFLSGNITNLSGLLPFFQDSHYVFFKRFSYLVASHTSAYTLSNDLAEAIGTGSIEVAMRFNDQYF